MVKKESALLTRKEVQAWLKVGNNKIFKMISSREIPAIRVGTTYRFKREDIENYLRRHAL